MKPSPIMSKNQGRKAAAKEIEPGSTITEESYSRRKIANGGEVVEEYRKTKTIVAPPRRKQGEFWRQLPVLGPIVISAADLVLSQLRKSS